MEAEERRHELETKRLELEAQNHYSHIKGVVKAPTFPAFEDEKDELGRYLQRFKQSATKAKWDRNGWAIKLSALLTGRTVEVYILDCQKLRF